MALILAALCSLVSNGSGERKEGIWTVGNMGYPINEGSCGFLLTVSVFITGPSSTETGWSWAWRLKEPANSNRDTMSNRPLIQRRILLKNNADSSLNEGYMDPESHPSGSGFFPGLRGIDSILIRLRVYGRHASSCENWPSHLLQCHI